MQATELEYAGFWIRLGASLIDTVLLMLVCFPLLIWIYGWDYLGNDGLIAGPADFLISWVAPTIATILFWRYRQATPGKMILSLRIVTRKPATRLRSVRRSGATSGISFPRSCCASASTGSRSIAGSRAGTTSWRERWWCARNCAAPSRCGSMRRNCRAGVAQRIPPFAL